MDAVKKKQKGGKKNRKVGRNKSKCLRYTNMSKQRSNKMRRLRKQIKHHPNDRCAINALDLMTKTL